MLQRFAGKRCVVTASTQGIGLAVAQRLALEGADVVLSSRKQAQVDAAVAETEALLSAVFETGTAAERLLQLAAGAAAALPPAQVAAARATVPGLVRQGLLRPGRVAGTPCHVGKAEDRARLLAFATDRATFSQRHQHKREEEGEAPKIDVLVLNAASSVHYGNLLDMKESEMHKMLETNISSVFSLAKEVRPHLRLDRYYRLPGAAAGVDLAYYPSNYKNRSEAQRNVLFPPAAFHPNLLITSSLGAYVPCSPIGFYSVSKTALLGLTRALAEQYAEYGVRVNCVCPGVVKTRLASLLVEEVDRHGGGGSDAAAAAAAEQKVFNVAGGLNSGGFMRRVGVPEEIAAAAAFLCSADGSFVTAESLVVGGGSFARL